MDGSESGYYIREGEEPQNVYLYLSGGGFCLPDLPCENDRFGEVERDEFLMGKGTRGLFALDSLSNPIRAWTQVFVPYCSGDAHGGNRADAFISGQPRQFFGAKNLALILDDIEEDHLQPAERFLIAGSSAGAFGLASTGNLILGQLRRVAEAPSPTKTVHVLFDSGVVFPQDDAFSPLLQGVFCAAWGRFGDKRCDAISPGVFGKETDRLGETLPWLFEQYPEVSFGLVTHDADLTVRRVFGPGFPEEPGCSDNGCALPEERFQAALYNLRDRAKLARSNFTTMYIPGDAHSFLAHDLLYTDSVDGVGVDKWVADFLEGKATHLPLGAKD